MLLQHKAGLGDAFRSDFFDGSNLECNILVPNLCGLINLMDLTAFEKSILYLTCYFLTLSLQSTALMSILSFPHGDALMTLTPLGAFSSHHESVSVSAVRGPFQPP